MIKDLLLVVDYDRDDDAIIKGVVQFARERQAQLAVMIVAAEPVPDYHMSVYPPFITLDEYREKTKAKEAAIRGHAERGGMEVEVRILSDTVQALLDETPAQTRYADLVIFGPVESWGDRWLRRRVLENVVLGSGRPVLLIPADGATPAFQRIMIGWNASAEATRAVQIALAYLESGAEVTVVTINAEDAKADHGSEAGTHLGCHLSRHGLQVDVMNAAAPSGNEAEALRDLARGRGADLLVLGAFARSRLRELIFGGVTHDIIENGNVPVLLMH